MFKKRLASQCDWVELTEQQQINISPEMFEGIISVIKSKPSGSLVELHMEVDSTGHSHILSIRMLLVGHNHKSLDA